MTEHLDVTAMRTVFGAMREMFQTAVESGFSEHQACVMLGVFLASTIANGAGDNS